MAVKNVVAIVKTDVATTFYLSLILILINFFEMVILLNAVDVAQSYADFVP